jgi:hypothetical protein
MLWQVHRHGRDLRARCFQTPRRDTLLVSQSE